MYLVFLVLGLTSVVEAQQFTASQTFSIGGGMRALALGDIDGDIDILVGNTKSSLGVKIYSIDTLPNLRRYSDWFRKAVGEIKKELSEVLPFYLKITIGYDAVTKGQDWADVRQNLKTWMINKSPSLADGKQVLEGVPGIPFPLHVRKASERRPGIFFAIFEPYDDILPNRIRKQFDRKAKKLKKYRDPDKTTVLLVENDDFQGMNEDKMLDAIQEAYPNGLPNNVDKIWYADTSIPDDIEFIDFTPKILQGATQQVNAADQKRL